MNVFLILSYFFICVAIVLVCLALYKIVMSKRIMIVDQHSNISSLPLVFRIIRIVSTYLGFNFAQSKADNHRREKLKKRLYDAGLDLLVYPKEFVLLKNIIMLTAFLVCLSLYSFNALNNMVYLLLLLSFLAWIYMLPDIWLNNKYKHRREHFSRLFPFMLDLLVLSIRAGVTFTAAIDHAVKRMPDGSVKIEFATVLFDIRTGLSRKEALYAMSKRINLLAVNNFVSVVNQVEETGGELGNVLSLQARYRRTERFLHAEKLANQAAVKLLAPLIGLLFPVTIILILFPVYMKAKNTGSLSMLF